MSIKKRAYSTEFKAEAIELAEKIGMSQAGKDLGINPNNISRWKLEAKQPQGRKQQKSMADLEKECSQLQKEIGYLRKINEVLKKSTAIFSNDKF